MFFLRKIAPVVVIIITTIGEEGTGRVGEPDNILFSSDAWSKLTARHYEQKRLFSFLAKPVIYLIPTIPVRDLTHLSNHKE